METHSTRVKKLLRLLSNEVASLLEAALKTLLNLRISMSPRVICHSENSLEKLMLGTTTTNERRLKKRKHPFRLLKRIDQQA